MCLLTIVTGASSNHFRCLLNLVRSIRHFKPRALVIVYDLGLNETERGTLNAVVHLRKFDFSVHPSWIDIRVQYGQYAWKPIILSDALDECGGAVLWLDAGNLVLNSLDRVQREIERNGVITPTSPGRIKDWTHPDTLRFLNVPESHFGRRNRNGAIIGFDRHCKWALDFAHRWKECALIKECIAPEGSNRKNHRQDQAVLSALYYQFQEKYGFDMADATPEISRHNDSLSADDLTKMLASAP
jgi:hypothetical protein